MNVEESLERSCVQYIRENLYFNATGDLEKKPCLGTQSQDDIDLAIKDKTVARLKVSPNCMGYFFTRKGSSEIRCANCIDNMYILAAANVRKKKVVS